VRLKLCIVSKSAFDWQKPFDEDKAKARVRVRGSNSLNDLAGFIIRTHSTPLTGCNAIENLDYMQAAVLIEGMKCARSSLDGPSLELERGRERFWRVGGTKRAGIAARGSKGQSGKAKTQKSLQKRGVYFDEESSHVWLNEGFTTYYESLYTAHKHGREAMLYEFYQRVRMITAIPDDTQAIVRRAYHKPGEMLGYLSYPKAIAVLQIFANAAKGAPGQPAAERAVAELHAGRKPVDDFKNLRREVLDLQKANRDLRKDLDDLKKKLEAAPSNPPPPPKKKLLSGKP